jgi:transposase
MADVTPPREVFKVLWQIGERNTSQLANATKRPCSTIRRWKNWMKTRQSIDRVVQKNRRHVVTAKHAARLARLAELHPRWPAAALNERAVQLNSTNVHKSTVSRTLKKCGFERKAVNYVFKLTQKHIAQRVKFCEMYKEWTVEDWKRIVFSDESSFQRDRRVRKVWTRKKRVQLERVKHEPNIMIWGGISFHGATPISVVKGSINSEKYQEVLDECLLEPMREIYKSEPWMFMQDNAPPHVSKATRKWFVNNNVQLLDWPPNSPDLNCIEHLWAIMKQRIEKEVPPTIAALEKVIHEEWERAQCDGTIQNLVLSMPRRIAACLKARGGHFHCERER